MQMFKAVFDRFSIALSVFFIVISGAYLHAPVLQAGVADADDEARTLTGFTEEAELLAEIPENVRIIGEAIKVDPRSGTVAYVYEAGDDFKVCMNNQCGPHVDRVARDMPVVSPNGKYMAALVQTDGDARVMLGEDMSNAHDMVYGLRFSPDSTKLSYIAQKDDRFSVHVNQEQHQAFALVDTQQGLVFSPDASRLAYVASKDGQSWHLVHDGETGAAYEQIKHVTFSPDSDRLAYAAKKDGRWHLVEGDTRSPGYLDIKRVSISRDSERLVYVARGDDGAFVVLDGEKSDVFDHVPGEPVFSRDGERLAYAVAEERRRDVRMRMVVDGQAGPAFSRIGAYRFSPDGSQFAYMAVTDEDKGLMVHNGEASDVFASIGVPVFAPKGGDLGYFVFQEENNKWHVNRNGEKGPALDVVENPIFGPEGERMVYTGRIGDRTLVIEGGDIVGNHEWAAMPTFSPDGNHLAYQAAEGGESFLVVDGHKGNERFLSFFRGSRLVFTDKDTVKAVAVRDEGRSFWHIRATMDE